MLKKYKPKTILKRIWFFIWHEDSIWSWIANIIIALVLVKFIIYPGLGLILSTQFPIVAVVSSSMEHNADFDEWWSTSSEWYVENGITREQMIKYPFHNGFNKGDIMVLKGVKSENLEMGQILVFIGNSKDPIIHRVVDKKTENNKYMFTTKGDNNPKPYPDIGETAITEEKLLGKAIFRMPFLGWVKIIFVSLWR